MDPEVTPQAATPAPAPVQATPAPAPQAAASVPELPQSANQPSAPAVQQPQAATPAPAPVQPQAAPVQAAPNTPSAPAQVEPAPKAGVLTTIESAMRGKAAILAENKVFKQRAEAAESALASTQAELTQAQTELASLKAEHAQIEALLSTAQDNEKSVVQQATDLVAQSGIPAEELPEQEAEDSDFASRYKAAQKAGGVTLGKFMKENRAEINSMLRGQG